MARAMSRCLSNYINFFCVVKFPFFVARSFLANLAEEKGMNMKISSFSLPPPAIIIRDANESVIMMSKYIFGGIITSHEASYIVKSSRQINVHIQFLHLLPSFRIYF